MLYFLVTLKDARFIPVLGLLQAALLLVYLGPSFSWDILNQRITVDVVGLGIVTLLGFNFFGSFINTSGLEQVKLQTELAVAQTMQTTLVPPVECRTARWGVYGKSIPSDKVGGRPGGCDYRRRKPARLCRGCIGTRHSRRVVNGNGEDGSPGVPSIPPGAGGFSGRTEPCSSERKGAGHCSQPWLA